MSWTQKKRAAIISRCLGPRITGGKRVLDVGCGNGEVSLYLQDELGLDLHGTDIIDYRKTSNARLKFTLMEGKDEIPFGDRAFDIVMFCDVLHHMEDIESILLEGRRVASEGIFVFEDCESTLLKAVDLGLNFAYCRNMPCPLNFKTREEWTALFEKLGFSFETLDPGYPFWYPFRHMAFRILLDPENRILEDGSNAGDHG